MNQMVFVILILTQVLWLWTPSVFAQKPQKDFLLHPHTLEDLEYFAADNPRDAVAAAEAYLKSPQGLLRDRTWIHANILAIYGRGLATEGVRKAVDSKEFFQALEIARAEKYEAETIILLSIAGEFLEKNERAQKRESLRKEALERARKLGEPVLLVRVLAETALFYEDFKADTATALALAKEAEQLMANTPQFPRFQAAMSETKLGILYELKGIAIDEVIKRSQRILVEFQALGLRQFQIVMLYNLAISFRRQDAGKGFEEARGYLKQILELSPQIDDWATYAQALGVLADMDAELGRYKEAEIAIQSSLGLLRSKDTNAYQGMLIDFASDIAIAAKQWKQALRYLDLAANAGELRDPYYAREIDRKRHKIFAELKQFPEAYASLKSYHESYVALHKESQDRLIEKMKVESGLTVAEEKAKNLELENTLQASRLEGLKRLNYALAAVGVLALASLACLGLWLRQARALRQEQAKHQQISELMDEGILQVDGQGLIVESHAAHLQSLFPGKPWVGVALTEALFAPSDLTSEEISKVMRYLSMSLGQSLASWETHHIHLPSMISFREELYLSLHWQALQKEGRVIGLLVALRDVSRRAQLERKLREEKERSMVIHSQLHELFSVSFLDACQLIERVRQAIAVEAGQSFELLLWQEVKNDAKRLGLHNLAAVLAELTDQHAVIMSREKALAKLQAQLESYGALIDDLRSGYWSQNQILPDVSA